MGSAGWGYTLKFCSSKAFPGDADTAGPQVTQQQQTSKTNFPFTIKYFEKALATAQSTTFVKISKKKIRGSQ